MNLEDFNFRELEKNVSKGNSTDSVLSNFIKDLTNALEKKQDEKSEELNDIRKYRKN